MAERIAVGRINGAWGLKGHLKVTPFTSNPERLQPGSVLIVRGERRRVLERVDPYGYPMLILEGYRDRSAAESLRGELIEIEEEELGSLPEGEYYIHDLIGIEVVTSEGERVGEVSDVLSTGANDVYVIRRDGRRDALVPAISDVVVDVNLTERRITIEPMPGLLD
jgi:16S rRNA processing protein RimM